jgi:hypothetical protein
MKSGGPQSISRRIKGKEKNDKSQKKFDAQNNIVNKLRLIPQVAELQFSGTSTWPAKKEVKRI